MGVGMQAVHARTRGSVVEDTQTCSPNHETPVRFFLHTICTRSVHDLLATSGNLRAIPPRPARSSTEIPLPCTGAHARPRALGSDRSG
eukprot:6190783-Pleurochrysis_carterae.AAC.1